MGAVKPVGQLYGSPTVLTSQYLAWDRYCTYVVQTLRVERRIFLEQIRPTVASERREGDQSYVVQTLRVERRIFLEQIRPTVASERREGDQSLM